MISAKLKTGWLSIKNNNPDNQINDFLGFKSNLSVFRNSGSQKSGPKRVF